MFGANTGATSTWGQPQQQQQQNPQATNAFGQPANAFGTTGQTAFGGASTGAFGQPQQQQPQGNTMFGGFGQTQPQQQPGTTTAFGGFGATTTNSTSAFGAPKPATTGFGTSFGAQPPAGTTTTGTFGTSFGANTAQQPSATGAFGQPTTSQSGGFGAGTAFGAKPTTTFGATATPATNPDGSVAPVTTGTSNPPYSVFNDKDPANSAINLQYQGITCMPAYRGTSLEELRWQDYQQNRKTAQATGTGGFGAFGSTTAAPATGTGIFGSTTTTQPAPTFGFGAQNQQQPQQPTTTGFGTFGQQNTNPTGTGFGFGTQNSQQQQQPTTTGFGFGTQNTQQQQQQQQPAGSGLFGGGAFGQNQSKPAFSSGFGTTGTNSAFGATATPATNAFGQQQNQQQPATGNSIFGQAQPSTTTTTTGFGGFGNNAAKPTGLFGGTQPTQPSAFGSFGTQQQPNQQQQQQQQQQPATGGIFGGGTGLFGQNTQQQPQQGQTQQPASTGLFGGTTQPAQNTGTSLFGNTGGGLFGNTQQQQQQQPATSFGAGGLFGPKPATTAPTAGTGLFGTAAPMTAAPTAAAPTGLFGNAQPAQPTGNSLFGSTNTGLFGSTMNKPPAPAFGAVPSMSQPATGGLFNSTLGTSALGATSTAAPLTASVAQPIGANIPIFNLLNNGPRAVPIDPPKKKVNFFPDASLTRSPVPRLQLGYTPSSSKLRGFGASTTTPGQLGTSLALSTSRPNGLGASQNGGSTESFFNGNSSTFSLGSGSRQSVKKLVLDRKVDSSDIFAKTVGRATPGAFKPGSHASSSKISFNPALSIAAREAAGQERGESPAPVPKKTGAARFNSARESSIAPEAPSAEGSLAKVDGGAQLQDGDYYIKPSIDKLKSLGYEQLTAFEGLVVGRVGRGEVQFLEPVNLTEVPRLQELMGGLIQFGEQDCVIYPDYDEADKPPPGQGINVPARIEILGAWPLDRATKEPIKDESHPSAAKHLKRLQKMKETHFESFDFKTGKWTFTVDHF